MTRLGAIGLALLALAVFVAPAAADDLEHCRYSTTAPNKQASIDACTRLIASGRFRGDELAKLYVSRTSTLYDIDQYDLAISDATEVITKVLAQPPNAKVTNDILRDAYYYRGNSNYWKKDFAKAIPDLTVVIDNYPKDYNAFYARGAAHLALRNADRAVADFDATIRISERHQLAHRQRAVAYEQKNDLPKALADAQRALEIEKANGYGGSTEMEIIKRIEQKIAASGGSKSAPESVTAQPAPAPAPKQAAPAPPPPSPPVAVAVAPTAQPKQAPPPAPAVVPIGKRVALVIGNGAYQHNTRLTNPANDAADIAQALRKLGFEVVEGRDLDKRGMEDKIREFGRKLDRAELALFYYAGHGLQVSGKNYLLPVDGKLERPADLHFDTIDVHFVLAQMESDQRVNLIFLDACRDNPLARTLARTLGTRSGSVGQGLASIQSGLGTMIGYATQPDAVALDGDGRNSPFTAAMVKHLATPGLEIGTLMRRVRADVVAATKGRQVPWDHSSLLGEVVLAR